MPASSYDPLDEAADMTSNIRPLKRRLRLTKGRLVGKMSQERQKLSFFIVIMFLVIFGLIVLAEVLFMEDRNEIFYDGASDSLDLSVGPWETPKPLLPLMSVFDSGQNSAAAKEAEERSKLKSEKLKESLKRHQEEMERLIKNISLRIKSQKSTESPSVSLPYKYEEEASLDFDFSLQKHKGESTKLFFF